jgi:type VI secretion system protein ImpF
MQGPQRKDRLSPPLMYAFRSAFAARDAKKKSERVDESGDRVVTGRRSAGRAPITELQLRREVATDLDSLMNTIALESAEDIQEFEHVRKSVLNYGFPDIVHRSIDEMSVDSIVGELEQVLIAFEPRIDRGSIQASRDTSLSAHELKVRFVVRAELRCEPVNVPVEFVADVEVDGSNIQISRL